MEKHIYIVSAAERYRKIGITSAVRTRVAALRTGCPFPIKLSHSCKVAEHLALAAERLAHGQLKDRRLAGEWFDCSLEQAIAAVEFGLAGAGVEVAEAVRREKDLLKGLQVNVGRALSEAVKAVGKPKAEIAEKMGISRVHLYDLLAGKKAITPRMAFKIGEVIGGDAFTWMALQNREDMQRVQQEKAAELAAITPHPDASKIDWEAIPEVAAAKADLRAEGSAHP